MPHRVYLSYTASDVFTSNALEQTILKRTVEIINSSRTNFNLVFLKLLDFKKFHIAEITLNGQSKGHRQ